MKFNLLIKKDNVDKELINIPYIIFKSNENPDCFILGVDQKDFDFSILDKIKMKQRHYSFDLLNKDDGSVFVVETPNKYYMFNLYQEFDIFIMGIMNDPSFHDEFCISIVENSKSNLKSYSFSFQGIN